MLNKSLLMQRNALSLKKVQLIISSNCLLDLVLKNRTKPRNNSPAYPWAIWQSPLVHWDSTSRARRWQLLGSVPLRDREARLVPRVEIHPVSAGYRPSSWKEKGENGSKTSTHSHANRGGRFQEGSLPTDILSWGCRFYTLPRVNSSADDKGRD